MGDRIKIRCNCGAFMQVDTGVDESSNEYYEAQCNRCNKEKIVRE